MFASLLCLLLPLCCWHFACAENYDQIRVENLQIQVKNVQSSKFLGKFGVPAGEKFAKILRLEKHLSAILTFRIVDGIKGDPIEGIQQAFLRLCHSKAVENEVFFIAKRVRDEKERGKYMLEIALQRDENRFRARPGRYNCELIIGDTRIKHAFRWHFIDAFIDIPKLEKLKPSEKRSYEPSADRMAKFEPIPELLHKFRPTETCNFKMWSIFYLFTAICALPLILLIKFWGPLLKDALKAMFSPPHFPWAQIFFTLIFSIFALLSYTWLHAYSVAFTLQILPIIGLFCFLAGNKTLNIVAKERIEEEEKEDGKEQEEEDEKEDGKEEEEEDEKEDGKGDEEEGSDEDEKGGKGEGEDEEGEDEMEKEEKGEERDEDEKEDGKGDEEEKGEEKEEKEEETSKKIHAKTIC